MEFVEHDVPQASRNIRVNMLYSKNKGNTYFLLDLNGLPSDNTWKILMNNYRFYNKDSYPFISNKEVPNDKFLISKFFNVFFSKSKRYTFRKTELLF